MEAPFAPAPTHRDPRIRSPSSTGPPSEARALTVLIEQTAPETVANRALTGQSVNQLNNLEEEK